MRNIVLTGYRKLGALPPGGLRTPLIIYFSCTATTADYLILETKIRLGVLKLRKSSGAYRDDMLCALADLRAQSIRRGGKQSMAMWIMSTDKPLLRALLSQPGTTVKGRL